MLRFAYVRFTLIFPNGAILPRWIGSALRGGLGYALKNNVCTPPSCPFCRNAPCLFRGVYTTRKEKRGFAEPPKPLSIIAQPYSSEMNLKSEETISFDAILLGDYVRSFRQLFVGLKYLGKFGVGSERVYGVNRFEIESAYDALTGRPIDDRSEPPSYDISEVKPLEEKRYLISSRTPFTGPLPPQTADSLLKEVWRRLIILVNEYGDGSRIMLPSSAMKYVLRRAERITLKRRSSRSLKSEFKGWMFDSEVDLTGTSDSERWLLAVGSFLGMGSDFTFGLGHYKILELS